VKPVTNEVVYKPKHDNWSFDYYNKDKPKYSISNDRPQVVNTNFNRVYDPITNRYFK
jgi:hypothetical protein